TRLAEARARGHRQTGLLHELADQRLRFRLPAVDRAAGQVEIAALATVDAHARQQAVAKAQPKGAGAPQVVQPRFGRAELKPHQSSPISESHGSTRPASTSATETAGQPTDDP